MAQHGLAQHSSTWLSSARLGTRGTAQLSSMQLGTAQHSSAGVILLCLSDEDCFFSFDVNYGQDHFSQFPDSKGGGQKLVNDSDAQFSSGKCS